MRTGKHILKCSRFYLLTPKFFLRPCVLLAPDLILWSLIWNINLPKSRSSSCTSFAQQKFPVSFYFLPNTPKTAFFLYPESNSGPCACEAGAALLLHSRSPHIFPYREKGPGWSHGLPRSVQPLTGRALAAPRCRPPPVEDAAGPGSPSSPSVQGLLVAGTRSGEGTQWPDTRDPVAGTAAGEDSPPAQQ